MVPVPLTYLLAAAAGVVIGVAAQAAVGWPWWLVAGGFVAAVWLFFLSTAAWGAPENRRAVVWLLAPRRAARLDVRDAANALIKSELGVELRYPTFREGLRSLMSKETPPSR